MKDSDLAIYFSFTKDVRADVVIKFNITKLIRSFVVTQAVDPDSGSWGEVKFSIYGSGADL